MIKHSLLLCIFLFCFIPLFSQSPVNDNTWSLQSYPMSFDFSNGAQNSLTTGNWVLSYNQESDNNSDWCLNGENVSIKSILSIDYLHLEAVADCFCGTGKPISSALINSKQTYYYGYFEASIQYNDQGPTILPAFWLYDQVGIDCHTDPNYWYNEIDNEIRGNGSNLQFTYNVHYYAGAGHCSDMNTINGVPSLNTYAPYTFHKYGIEWDPDQIIWYLDDVPVQMYRESNTINNNQYGHVPCNPMQIIFSIFYLFGAGPGHDVHNIPQDLMPANMNIAYFKYYTLLQHGGGSGNCPPPDYTTCLFNPLTYTYEIKNNICIGGNGSCGAGSLCSTTLSTSDKVTLRAANNTTIYGDFQVPLGAQFTILPTQCFNSYNPSYPCTSN